MWLYMYKQYVHAWEFQKVRLQREGARDAGLYALLCGQEPIQRLQVPLRCHTKWRLPHAVVWTAQQIHAAQGETDSAVLVACWVVAGLTVYTNSHIASRALWRRHRRRRCCLQSFECPMYHEPKVFEMFITPDVEYPLLCRGVHRGWDHAHTTTGCALIFSSDNVYSWLGSHQVVCIWMWMYLLFQRWLSGEVWCDRSKFNC